MTAATFTPSFLDELPRRFADFLAERTGDDPREVWLGAALASQQTLEGGACLDLREYAGRPWPDNAAPAEALAPSLPDWMTALRASGSVGAPGENRPLVLTDAGRLYLHRYWEYEDKVAHDLERRAATRPEGIDLDTLTNTWNGLPVREQLSEGQRVAAVTAILRGLAVISGGAGTGKTTIVACILRLLASQSQPDRPLRVRLAAPTGKAAGRLKEQLREYRGSLDSDGTIDRIMRDEPATLHRLLGGSPNATRLRHNAEQPLPLDALIIDETSMVDLAMMAKVVDALPKAARLVLIGDKDQLPPVGVGSVFGELCAASPAPPPELRSEIERVTGHAPSPASDQATALSGSITLLRHSFRFDEASGIGTLASAIRAGDGAALTQLVEHPPADISWIPTEASAPTDLGPAVATRVTDGFAPFLDAIRKHAAPADVLTSFNRFRVLCVLRDGPSGVTSWNARIEAHFRRRRRIAAGQTWYEGRPVLVTRNDYAQRLWNGDIGVALRRDDGKLRVYFEGTSGELRDLPPGRLSHAETAYALTVHKSQGSEFEHVLLALPDADSRLVSRELLYTGATRARSKLDILGDPQRFAEGMFKQLPRTSGLAEALGVKDFPQPPVPKATPPPTTREGGPPQGELF
ncbi:MAG: exodeoxyribonuclease V subunit alpha [Candidatus Binatia bacterium]|nr:exodeoxyribonuclease V subunit alpha [Candidatus Binatia bacterium]